MVHDVRCIQRWSALNEYEVFWIDASDRAKINQMLLANGDHARKNMQGVSEIIDASLNDISRRIGKIDASNRLRLSRIEISLPYERWAFLDDIASKQNGGVKAVIGHLAISDYYTRFLQERLMGRDPVKIEFPSASLNGFKVEVRI